MKVLFVFIGLMTGVYCCAQERLLSVNEVVALALQNNFDIEVSRNDSALAALDYAFNRYSFFPTLNATGTANFVDNNQRQILADGSKRQQPSIRSNNKQASLNLSWILFDGMRMFITRQRLRSLIGLGEAGIKAQVVNSVAETMRLYFDVVRQQNQQVAIREQIALAGERLKLAQYKFDIGTGTKQDVLQAQIDANAQQSLLLNAQAAVDLLKQQLSNTTGLALGTDWQPADTIEISPLLTLDTLQAGIEQSNPELLQVQRSREVANLALRERLAERYPVAAFNAAYNFTRNNNLTVINPFQPLFNQVRGFNYGFVLNIPIFNNYINRRNIAAAQLNIRFIDVQYQRSRALVLTNMNTAYRNYLLARETQLLEEETIKLVRENLFIARERYRLGVTTFLEMRTAEQNLADAQSRLINARFNIKAAEIELMRVRGDLIK